MDMKSTLFQGRGQLVSRLISQLGGNKAFAYNLLTKRGDMNPDGTLTAKGEKRNNMTAGERAFDRAGVTPATHYYDEETNTVKKTLI